MEGGQAQSTHQSPQHSQVRRTAGRVAQLARLPPQGRTLLQECLKGPRQAWGDLHPLTLNCKSNLGPAIMRQVMASLLLMVPLHQLGHTRTIAPARRPQAKLDMQAGRADDDDDDDDEDDDEDE